MPKRVYIHISVTIHICLVNPNHRISLDQPQRNFSSSQRVEPREILNFLWNYKTLFWSICQLKYQGWNQRNSLVELNNPSSTVIFSGFWTEFSLGSKKRVTYILVGLFGGLGFIALLVLVLLLVLKLGKKENTNQRNNC